jgi:hypothetical protein
MPCQVQVTEVGTNCGMGLLLHPVFFVADVHYAFPSIYSVDALHLQVGMANPTPLWRPAGLDAAAVQVVQTHIAKLHTFTAAAVATSLDAVIEALQRTAIRALEGINLARSITHKVGQATIRFELIFPNAPAAPVAVVTHFEPAVDHTSALLPAGSTAAALVATTMQIIQDDLDENHMDVFTQAHQSEVTPIGPLSSAATASPDSLLTPYLTALVRHSCLFLIELELYHRRDPTGVCRFLAQC